ncbi:putative phage head-tail adaptor [Enterococcus faecalis 13-SD-W-01]|nr:putative phage head-tail adaptor [Enterococcus faecalis 13-SD-W-01]
MYEPQDFQIQEIKEQRPDGIGGLIDDWVLFQRVSGYLDLLTGADNTNQQNAFTEDSTHILVTTYFVGGITDQMRVIDSNNRIYAITYSDNPVNIQHHTELYLKFEGTLNGK